MNISLRERMSSDLALSAAEVERLIQRAPFSYKRYTIPKRSGGTREIAQPAREIKYLQNWLIRRYLENLPIHNSATAYKRGSSIKMNLEAHVGNEYVSKFDFNNFFTSIKLEAIVVFLEESLSEDLTKEDAQDLARICCIRRSTNNLHLSIGAPSSPIVSNTILYKFDQTVSEWCAKENITYTRYADDLTFSTNVKGKSKEIEKFVSTTVGRMKSPNLRLNKMKTIHLSKKHQRRITGLILTNDDKISLGRDRKRLISSLIHRYTLNQLDEQSTLKLQGLLGFAKDVEPLFVSRMRAKYRSDVIREILQKRSR